MSSPSPSRFTRDRRRVRFADGEETSINDDVVSLGFLRHTLVCSEGTTLALDYTGLSCPRLVRHLTAALAARVGVGGGHITTGTARMYSGAIRAFIPLVAARHPAQAECIDAGDISAADLDTFEEAERQRFPSASTMPYLHIGSLVRLLGTVAAGGLVSLRPDLLARLDFVANGEKGHTTPRDAYSPHETAQLRAACRADVLRVVERLTVTAEQRLALGREPVGAGWRVADNVVWHVDRNGPLSLNELQERQGRRNVGFRMVDVHAALYPTRDDLVPFLLLLALESGIEIEACKELRADCLGNTEGGRVEVRYRKRRAGTRQERSVWVRDSGMYSPGRLIRIVLRLTQRARAHSGSEHLWLVIFQSRLHPAAMTAGSGVFAKFVKRYDLRGDDGRPLRLQPVRLRKTHKAGRYLATNGQLEDFAGGNHTPSVAGDHYGAIEALRRFHEAAIERALHDAVAVARSATVLTADEEDALFADPVAGSDVLGVAPAQVKALLGGEQDVWLSSCRDFFDSPFGTPGAACPTPFWACLGCANAVITTRKLPALLSFLAHVVEARSAMPADQWAATYGEAHRQLTENVLPRFPPAVVAAARAAADLDPELIYLPPQLAGVPL
ncbi:MAG TPA: hypothetical protein VGV93_01525 [Acidimicrobiales bacterium]|nr:hypothetical protein [Acidimicrobiales bacterium]